VGLVTGLLVQRGRVLRSAVPADDTSPFGSCRLWNSAGAALTTLYELESDNGPGTAHDQEHGVRADQTADVAPDESADRQADGSGQHSDPASHAQGVASFLHGPNVPPHSDRGR
jgi:hypothetical protein